MKIGGRSAQITQVSNMPGPLHEIYAISPAGASGPADVTVTTPAGSATLHSGYSYYSFSAPGGTVSVGQMVYDSSRQVLYVADSPINVVDVFSPSSNKVVSSLPCGQTPLGIALSPDKSKLVVANWGSQSVSLIVFASATQQQIVINLNGNGPGSLHPQAVAIANNGKALVGAVDTDGLDNGALFELDFASNQLTLVSDDGGLSLTSDIE